MNVLADGSLDTQKMIADLNVTKLVDVKELIMFYYKFPDPVPESIWVQINKSVPEIQSFPDKHNCPNSSGYG